MPFVLYLKQSLFYCLFIALTLIMRIGYAQNVVIVLSENTPAYKEFASSFQAAWQGSADIVDVEQCKGRTLDLPMTVIVAAGKGAQNYLRTRALNHASVLATLASHEANELSALRKQLPAGHFAALYLDQPLSRQIALLHLALPDFQHVALLTSPEERENAAHFIQAVREQNLAAIVEPIQSENDFLPALKRIAAESGVILMTPAPRIYNEQTLLNLLLATYRLDTPVVGFSPMHVKAGALMALYSTPAQLGQQAAGMLQAAIGTQTMPRDEYPRHFVIAVNKHVARSLEIDIETETVLQQRLLQLENAP